MACLSWVSGGARVQGDLSQSVRQGTPTVAQSGPSSRRKALPDRWTEHLQQARFLHVYVFHMKLRKRRFHLRPYLEIP